MRAAIMRTKRIGALSAVQRSTTVLPSSSSLLLMCNPAFSQGRRCFASTSLCFGKALKPFKLADIGEGITQVELVKWFVEVGQVVEEFDPVAEVMSDKATVEITSPYSGKITKLSGAVGDTVNVGSMLCEVEVENDEPEPAAPSTASVTPSPTSDSAPQTSSTSSASQAPPSGASSPPPSSSPKSDAPKKDVLATPATRRIARETSISLNDVPGTGKDGRVTKSDVLEYVASRNGNGSRKAASAAAPPPSAPVATPGGTTTIPLSPMRKAMFRAMTNSLQIPHFSYSETLDVTLLERVRTQLNADIPLRFRKTLTPLQESLLASNASTWGTPERVAPEGRYDRLTLLPLLLKALSKAMESHPLFRSTLAADQESLVLRESHDISIALSAPTGGGLYTPLLPAVDSTSLYGLASSIAHLQSVVPKFPAANRGNGTITLSNVGVVGGTTTHPVIPPTGQLAIGALGRMRVVPMYVGKETIDAAKKAAVDGSGGEALTVEPRLLMDVTFSADHRVVEGVELAKLVEDWKRIIENPGRLSA